MSIFTNIDCPSCHATVGIPKTVQQMPCSQCGRPIINPTYDNSLVIDRPEVQVTRKGPSVPIISGAEVPKSEERVYKEPSKTGSSLFTIPNYKGMKVKTLLEHKALIETAIEEKRAEMLEALELLK